MHALSGIRTLDPKDQAVADLRIRTHGHRDRRVYAYCFILQKCAVYSLIHSLISLSSSSSMALQPEVGQSLLFLGFHPEGFPSR